MVAIFLSKMSPEKTKIFNQFIFKNPGAIYTEDLLVYAKRLDDAKDLMDETTTVVIIDQHIDKKHSIYEKYIKAKDIPTIIMIRDINGLEYYSELRSKFPKSKINLAHLFQISHQDDVKKEIHKILQTDNRTTS